MPRITSSRQRRATAVTAPPYAPSIKHHPSREQAGPGRFTDAYPLTPDADIRAIRQAERSRNELLGADPEWWAGE